MKQRDLLWASRERLRRLQGDLRGLHFAAYLATDPVEVSYLSNFGGEDAYLFVPSRGKGTLLTDFRYREDAEQECPHVRVHVRTETLVVEVAALCERRRGPVAFNPDKVTVAVRRQLAQKVGAGRLKDAPRLIDRMRSVKDATEIAALRQALRIAQRAYRGFLERIRPGMTERKLAAELTCALYRSGADAPAFPVICAVGPNASRPHARPGNRRLTRRSPLLVDFGALSGGYRCDLTRMVPPARIPRDFREVYEAVLEAQRKAIAAAGPGVKAADVDRAAREALAEVGLAKAFGHGTGHGLGREVHEKPGVSQKSGDVVLEPGMVITVEPGVYLPGRFGIRIEDDVLITGKGRSVLSRLPKKLSAIGAPAC